MWGFVHIIYILLRQQNNRLFFWAVWQIKRVPIKTEHVGVWVTGLWHLFCTEK